MITVAPGVFAAAVRAVRVSAKITLLRTHKKFIEYAHLPELEAVSGFPGIVKDDLIEQVPAVLPRECADTFLIRCFHGIEKCCIWTGSADGFSDGYTYRVIIKITHN